jgi:hypothetical protein
MHELLPDGGDSNTNSAATDSKEKTHYNTMQKNLRNRQDQRKSPFLQIWIMATKRKMNCSEVFTTAV